jgi:hypothetical protein
MVCNGDEEYSALDQSRIGGGANGGFSVVADLLRGERSVSEEERKTMQVMNEGPNQSALTIEKSASVLGLHEFSLLSRIQAGEIKSARARSGEMVIPVDELERLSPDALRMRNVNSGEEVLPISDEQLGIKKTFGGLRQKGQYPVRFTVPGYEGKLMAGEKESYRAAFGAIERKLESATKLREQLNDASGLAEFSEGGIQNPQIGRWDVRAKLLALGRSDILLCQQADGAEFAIIERFRPESPYARNNGSAEILLQGDDPVQLNREFTANARHTLELMASNLVAKAQKIVWEQFPDHRPGHVVAAISERCRQAVANEETISQDRKHTRSVNRGVRI